MIRTPRAATVLDDPLPRYGGQVAAQALVAGRTVQAGRVPHPLHGYFLRSGDAARPAVFRVHRDRDGRSFTARRVEAVQDDEIVLSMAAPFQGLEEGLDRQVEPAPDVPAPEVLPPMPMPRLFSFEVRLPPQPHHGRAWPTRFWARCTAPPGGEDLLHAAVLTYLSDIMTGLSPLAADGYRSATSFDHAVWFHRPARLDDWILVDLVGRTTGGGRGWCTGTLSSRDGVLRAGVAQESLFRRSRRPFRRRGATDDCCDRTNGQVKRGGSATMRQDEAELVEAYRVRGALGFFEIAEADPDRIAVIDVDGSRTTFGELRALADRIARGLRAQGLAEGDTVAVALPNHRAFVALQLATSQVGLYLTALNWHLTASELAYILGDSEARLLLTGPRVGEAAAAAADEAGLPPQRRFAVPASPGFRPLDELIDGMPAAAPEGRRQGSVMLYTSGTTGRPKGVRKPLPRATPERSLAARVPILPRMLGRTAGDGVHLVAAPLYHAAPNAYGLLALHIGHTLVLMDKWTPQLFLELVERHRVTATHMVPIMFHRLLALPEAERRRHDLSSLTRIVHAGAPCPVPVKQAMMDWLGPVLHEYYAATEGGGTYVGPQDWLRRPGTVGRAWAGSEVHVLDDDGAALPPGRVGTIWFRSPETFEYFKAPGKTAAARRGDLFTVGDLGHLDEDGWLYLSDRRSDLIISGGVNIYPAEVEAVLLTHPAVADAAVIGVPDAEWGQRVVALVEPRADVGPAELLAHCRARLAAFKCPRSIEFRDLPRTATGKLSRAALRAERAAAAAGEA